MAALMRWASSQSRWLRGLAYHWEKACLENPSTRQVTATGSCRRPGLRPAGTSFWEGVAGEVGGRSAQDLVLLLQLLGARSQLPVLDLQRAVVGGIGGVGQGVFAKLRATCSLDCSP